MVVVGSEKENLEKESSRQSQIGEKWRARVTTVVVSLLRATRSRGNFASLYLFVNPLYKCIRKKESERRTNGFRENITRVL